MVRHTDDGLRERRGAGALALARRLGGFLAEFAFEAVLALAACAALAGLAAMVSWGWSRHPVATALAAAALVALLADGGWHLLPSHRDRPRNRLAAVAAACVVVVGVWLAYVLSYCACTLW